MEGLLQVGAISSTHGVRGEVKVFPTTDDVKRYSKLKEVILGEGSTAPLLHVESVKYQKNMVIVKFKEYNSLNEVENLRGKNLYVTRENAVKLNKNEYFVADLIGLSVIDEAKNIKGILKDVMPTGANDVYIIELEDGRELLLPAIKDCIKEVDISNGIMKVNVLDGLL
ncbi:MAG: 16S rRNA processing protein RimM [Lachnospiraceae bacterium]|nr:16S rRNA processing protein RimM [Lachnospiraceae bacterium]